MNTITERLTVIRGMLRLPLKDWPREEPHRAVAELLDLLESAEAERDRLQREVDRYRAKTFPVMLDLDYRRRKQLSALACPTSVPWAFIEQFSRTVKYNHSQTLERLAERGGLGPSEMMAAITNDTKWWDEPDEKCIPALKEAIRDWYGERSEDGGG